MTTESFRDELTQAFIEMLGKVSPDDYKLPWHQTGTIFGKNAALDPRNAITKTPYCGTNWIALAMASGLNKNGQNFTSARYATYRQWASIGGQVRKGSKGIRVIKVGTFTKEDEVKGRYIKVYTVFAAEQIDGVEAPGPEPVVTEVQRIATIEAFVAATSADIRTGGDRAYCSTNPNTGDRFVTVPVLERFTSVYGYYATILHELIHWTAHPLGRMDSPTESTAAENYAFEELVAELGSAMLCCQLGLASEAREDHAQYLKCWLGALKNDSSYLINAASKAQKAVDYLMGMSSTQTDVINAMVAEEEEALA